MYIGKSLNSHAIFSAISKFFSSGSKNIYFTGIEALAIA
jgi:hypothetical protein